jgi:hypothetical protein
LGIPPFQLEIFYTKEKLIIHTVKNLSIKAKNSFDQLIFTFISYVSEHCLKQVAFHSDSLSLLLNSGF